jgi:hypothetical protein
MISNLLSGDGCATKMRQRERRLSLSLNEQGLETLHCRNATWIHLGPHIRSSYAEACASASE